MYDTRGTKTCTIQEEQKHVRFKRNKNMYDSRGTKTCTIQEEQKHVRYKRNKNMYDTRGTKTCNLNVILAIIIFINWQRKTQHHGRQFCLTSPTLYHSTCRVIH